MFPTQRVSYTKNKERKKKKTKCNKFVKTESRETYRADNITILTILTNYL